jgi:hypothetical protein
MVPPTDDNRNVPVVAQYHTGLNKSLAGQVLDRLCNSGTPIPRSNATGAWW